MNSHKRSLMSRSLAGIVIPRYGLAIKITNFHGFLDFVNSDGFVMIKLSPEEDHDFQFCSTYAF